MKEQQAIPVIQYSDSPHITQCQGCDETENVRAYDFRVGRNMTTTIAWCNKCARTVATFLLKPERSR